MRGTKMHGTHAVLIYADSTNLSKIYIPESKTQKLY